MEGQVANDDGGGLVLLDVGAGEGEVTVRPHRHTSPRHPTHLEASYIELNCIV
jgi:hypothetical protein